MRFLILLLPVIFLGCGAIPLQKIEFAGTYTDESGEQIGGQIGLVLSKEATEEEGAPVLELENPDGTVEKLYTFTGDEIDLLEKARQELQIKVLDGADFSASTFIGGG